MHNLPAAAEALAFSDLAPFSTFFALWSRSVGFSLTTSYKFPSNNCSFPFLSTLLWMIPTLHTGF
jgi:hypothetical protein